MFIVDLIADFFSIIADLHIIRDGKRRRERKKTEKIITHGKRN